MTLKGVNLRPAYRSGRDNLIADFYVPCLKASESYSRAVGYFTSHGLCLAAKGIAHLAHSGGRMRLVASPHLQVADIAALGRGYSAEALAPIGARSLGEIHSTLVRDRIEALEWLVRNGMLEVALAIPVDKYGKPCMGLYHEKFGVFEAGDGSKVGFVGSANETEGGLVDNFESIQAFWSWEDPQNRVDGLIEDFEALWDNSTNNLEVVRFTEATREILRPYGAKRLRSLDAEEMVPAEGGSPVGVRKPAAITLLEHQHAAVNAWVEAKGVGIFAMATGAGKTITSLACAEEIYARSESPVALIIVVPYLVLLDQWVEELRKWGVIPIACARGRDKWLADARLMMQELRLATRPFGCLLTTNATFSSSPFQSVLSDAPDVTLLIADEVHNLGASRLSSVLPERVKLRLGLSATPDRHGDPIGSDALRAYFGAVVSAFSLKDALDADPPILCPYDYWPIPVRLTDEEAEEYLSLTTKIAKAMVAESNADNPSDRTLSLLLQRARLTGAARNKIPALLEAIAPYQSSSKTLVYCGDGSVDMEGVFPESNAGDSSEVRQVEAVATALTREGFRVATYTSETSAKERKKRLSRFSSDEIQALVAIRCLDEGVDLPDVRRAFILASSTNPRQYIQRRGRVLRKSPGKEFAEIFDFIVIPPEELFDPDAAATPPALRRLVEREFERVVEFCDTARNTWQARDRLRPALVALKMEHL
jgi:superfamily II DNA or RNA helicase